MSTAQVERLQALLSRVQTNRHKLRGAGPAAASEPAFTGSQLGNQDGIDTTPPPAAPAKAQPAPARVSAEPARGRPAEEHVRVPDLKPARAPAQPERALPVAARPTAPGATPLEMALEGEVARAAESAAAALYAREPAPAARPDEAAPRVLADPPPPQPSRPIAQAVTKHPPVQPSTFTELLKRSLALRPR